MKHLTKFLRTFQRRSEPKIVLGRWRIEQCEKTISYKVQLTNEDHCGTCGTYVFEKREPILKKEEENDDEQYMYYLL